MLASLSIRNIVLIQKLDLEFSKGLSVLTGETGAGKSILLDALGLATGARAESGLVTKGATQSSVTAVFEVADTHPVNTLLAEQALDDLGGQVLLRRTLSSDGRSKAFINDQPVAVSTLNRVGEALVEVHGQQDDRGLLDPAGHRRHLDAFGGHSGLLKKLAASHDAYEAVGIELENAELQLANARQDEEYLRHSVSEINELRPEPGEETKLADLRAAIQQGERAAEDFEAIHTMLVDGSSVEGVLRGAMRRLDRLEPAIRERLEPAIYALERAANEAEAGLLALENVMREVEFDPEKLDQTEQRLFALRALARKFKCTVDDLADLGAEMQSNIDALDVSTAGLEALRKRRLDAEAKFYRTAVAVTKARSKAASDLDRKVNAELDSLRLGSAKFRTRIVPLGKEDWGKDGSERALFEVATNKDAEFGGLKKIASGGELARFILALKVVLAGTGSAGTLVFDEVDRGIGGAVADAVGERLAALARAGAQVMVVTHSPQVAARGEHHFCITKADVAKANGDGSSLTVTDVAGLDASDRREEIARMLSGAAVTEEARKAADRLIAAG